MTLMANMESKLGNLQQSVSSALRALQSEWYALKDVEKYNDMSKFVL